MNRLTKLSLSIFVTFSLWETDLFSASSTWTNTGGAGQLWTNPANWSGGVPNAQDADAFLLNSITSDCTIDLNGNKTLANLTFDDNNNYTVFTTSGDLSFNADPATTVSITVSNANGDGNHSMTCDIGFSDPMTINHTSNGTFTISGRFSTGFGLSLTKTGGGTTILSGTTTNTILDLNLINGGTLVLAKTGAGITAMGGSVQLTNAGTILRTDQPDQFRSGTNFTINADTTFDLNDNNQMIAGAGGVGTIDLGTATLTLDSGSSDFPGVITGTGGITQATSGLFIMSGGTANTYTGLTQVTGGTLALNKTAGVNALAGNVSIGGGTLRLDAANQIPNTSTVTLSSGSLDLNGNAETISSLTFNGGTASQGGATLTLSGAGTVLTMRNVTLPGPVTIGGNATYDATNVGTATISGNVNLNAGTRTFTVNHNASNTIDMTVGGIISNGAVVKSGAGVLEFTGANTYFGGTTVSAGTLQGNTSSLVGLITNNSAIVFDQTTNGNFTGIISGSGTVTKQNSGTVSIGLAQSYSGTTTVSAGTLRALNLNVFPASSNYVVNGTLDLNGFSQQIASLSGSGTVSTGGGGVLTIALNSDSTFSGAITGIGGLAKEGPATLTLSGSASYAGATTILGTLRGGAANAFSVASNHSVGGTLDLGGFDQGIGGLNGSSTGIVALGANTLTCLGFGADTFFSGTITGVGGSFTLQSSNTLTFSSISPNTYSGLTTVASGTLALNKTPGINAIGGDATVNSLGTLRLNASNQIPDTSALTVNGTFNLNNFAEAIGSLAGSGSVTLGSGQLTTGASASTTFSGAISGVGGSLVKQGATTFILTGTNSYSGGTTVSAGTLQGNSSSLQGNILNNAALVFDQATTGTYAGVLTGNGTLTKQNSGDLIVSGASPAFTGTTAVSAGRLSVNGSLASSAMTVGASGTLGGTGTITAPITLNGTLAPGNSIGTITIVGDLVQTSGSTLEIEISPTDADRVNITGTYTIDPGARLLIIPEAGVYPSSFTRIIVDAPPGALTGTFSTVEVTLPTFAVSVIYDVGAGDVILASISELPFSDVIMGGNAGAVATCLDTLAAPAGSDLEIVLAELRMIPTVEGLSEALALLQPSQFTALALAQENATLYTNDAIFYRLGQNTRICPRPCAKTTTKSNRRRRSAPPETETCTAEKNRAFWAAPYGALSTQRRQNQQPGFSTGTGGAVFGADFNPTDIWTFGGALGYSYVDLDWKDSRGHAAMQNGYGALYTSAVGKYAYFFGSAIGSYNHYNARRHIVFGDGLLTDINRNAHSNHNGWQGSGHAQGGFFFGTNLQFSPFARADYIFVHENSFNEHGANSLDLHVEKKNSDLLEVEAGIELSRCFTMSKNKVSPSLGLSVIREWRFMGSRYKSSFDASSCVMGTKGINPDRTLFSGELGLTILLPNENRTLSFDYQGKWGRHFQDNRLMAQFLLRF